MGPNLIRIGRPLSLNLPLSALCGQRRKQLSASQEESLPQNPTLLDLGLSALLDVWVGVYLPHAVHTHCHRIEF